ncbi:hypothetical protein L7F22_060624 [Adiantum nelumboides]|nr:hypothetical protein [Adiantum nelumboides]
MAFPNFYGKPGEVAPDFLDNLEMAFLVSGRDDEATKLRAFPLVLREGAKAWYQTLAPEERRDWETLKTAFIEEFRHQEPPEEIWRQLLELRQTSPNDYRSYEGKFSNLWEKWCASLGEGERAPECLKKDCFLAGLYPILRKKVKVKFPDTFEKAMAYAREKDRKLKFQAQLQGGMEPPPPAQPIARTVAGTSATDQESSQQELLQQITNQLESLSINLVQGVRASQSGTDRNRQEGQRQTREYVCYNCGEVGHGMYFCPHPRRYQGNGNHRRALRQQVTTPRARPPNGQQNAPVAPPIQILRPPPPPRQTPAEIPPLPSGGEDRAVSVITHTLAEELKEIIDISSIIRLTTSLLKCSWTPAKSAILRYDSSRAVLVRNAAEFITKMLVIFGLSSARENEIGFNSDVATSSGSEEAILTPYLDAVAKFRDEVRAVVKEDVDIKGKVMGVADRFRDYTMVDLGVRLEDAASGSIWELVDAQTLRNLRDEKIREAQEAKRKSLLSKLEKKKKDLDRYEAALADPKDVFLRQKDLYSAYDLGGIPTHDGEGKELSKKARKDVEKKMKKAEDEHATILRKLEAEEVDLHQIRSDIASLETQLKNL